MILTGEKEGLGEKELLKCSWHDMRHRNTVQNVPHKP